MIKIQKGSSAKPEMVLEIHAELLYVFSKVNLWLESRGYMMLITSMIRPKTSDSGIHATGRAIDFLILDKNKEILPFCFVHQQLLDEINAEFVYDANKPKLNTLIWHSVGNKAFGGYHFHLQVNGDFNAGTS